MGRNFRFLVAGNFANDVSDWVLKLALPVHIFIETGSGSSMAGVFLVELSIGALLGPWGGSLADRLDLRRTAIATNLLHVIAVLPLVAVTPHRVWPVYLVAALQAALRQVNDPATFSLLPRVIADPEHLVSANATNSASQAIARLTGSPLGGVLLGLGGLSAIVTLNVIMYLAAALAIYLITLRPNQSTPTEPDERTPGTIREAARQVRARRDLSTFVGAEALAEIAFAMFPVVFVVFVVDELSGTEATVGLIRGVAAFGGLLASLWLSRVAIRSPWLMMVAGYVSLGLVDLTFANSARLTQALPLFFALFALSGLPNTTSEVGANATLQITCPPTMLGRVAGLRAASGAVAALAGTVLAGATVDRLGSIPLLSIQAGFYIAAGLVAWTGRPEGRAPPIRR